MSEFYPRGARTSTSNGRASYDLSGHISSAQRFRGDHRCPICSGTEDDPRGQGARCYGFLSTDGAWAHCTREEHAGQAVYNPGSQAYPHKLKGKCPCGMEHAPADSKPARPRKKRGPIDRTYCYADEQDRMLFETVRFKDPKDFAQRRPAGQGGWAWNLDGVRLVLYRLPELLAADPAAVVVIAEGEKDVDRLRSHGFLATCNPMGAGKWRAEYDESLRGRRVAILPDNDQAGRAHAEQVARSLAGIAAEIKVIDLPDLPEKGDVSDYLDRGGTAEALRQLLDGAPVWYPSPEPSPRPMIAITTEAHAVIDQAVAALALDPDVYQRAHALVRVVREPICATGLHRPVGSPRIAVIPTPTLFEKLSRYAEWVKPHTTRDGDTVMAPALPPDWAVAAVAVRADWPKIRPLEAVIEAPAMRPDGSILDGAGYDADTGLLFIPNATFPPLPARPTPEEARRAAGELLALVADFPFAEMVHQQGERDGGAAHRSAWLAALLTVLARFAIAGPTPLFAFDASTPGAGKTLLAELIARIASGRSLPRTTYPENDEEMRKRITSIVLASDRLMLIDNITSTFGGAALDAALTGNTWRDRALGRNEMTPELPLHVVWLATGNNLQFRGDILRRVIHCRLEPTQERPEERDPSSFAIQEPLPSYVSKQRPKLVAAGLTILRAYVAAGCPNQHLTAVDYREWSDLIRSAVFWVTGADPCASRQDLVATDPESTERGALVAGWAELPGSDRGVTTAEALRLLRDNPAQYATLRAVLTTRSGDLPSPKSVGMKLNAIRGRVIQGRSLHKVPAGHNNMQAWRVIVAPTFQGGTGGTGGTNSNTPRENCADNCQRPFGGRAEISSPSSPSSPVNPSIHVWESRDNEVDWSQF